MTKVSSLNNVILIERVGKPTARMTTAECMYQFHNNDTEVVFREKSTGRIIVTKMAYLTDGTGAPINNATLADNYLSTIIGA